MRVRPPALLAVTLAFLGAACAADDLIDDADDSEVDDAVPEGGKTDSLDGSDPGALSTWAAFHWTFVLGAIPADGNLPAAQVGFSVRSANSEPADTYFPMVQAGQTIEISTGITGIDKFGPPPEGWTGECYDSCLPRIQLVRFDRTFVGYKLDGVLQPEIELTPANKNVAKISIPVGTKTFEYWFRFQDAFSRNFWDSRSAKNYVVPVIPAQTATIKFAKSGKPTLIGPLVRGGGVRIQYDLRRMTQFPLGAGTTAQNLSRLELGITFDRMKSDEWQPLLAGARANVTPDIPALIGPTGWQYYPDEVRLSPVFKIPSDAQSVAVWAYGEAINLDVFPVERPGILDLTTGPVLADDLAPGLSIGQLTEFPFAAN